MAEIADHLVPAPRETRAAAGFDCMRAVGTEAVFEFALQADDGTPVGRCAFPIKPGNRVSLDAMLVDAHVEMINVVRHWLFELERARSAYQQRLGPEHRH